MMGAEGYSAAEPATPAVAAFISSAEVRAGIAAALHKDAASLGEVVAKTSRRLNSYMLKDWRVVCDVGGEMHTVRVFEHMKVGGPSTYTVEGVSRGDILATLG